MNPSHLDFHIGDRVIKDAGDYVFSGVIVAVFSKLSGVRRFIVENQDGVLHIFSEKNLKLDEKLLDITRSTS